MKQQTAVDWLFEQLEQRGEAWENVSIRRMQISIDVSEYLELKRQSREVVRQQIEDAYIAGDDNPIDTADYIRLSKADAANYFTEKFEQ